MTILAFLHAFEIKRVNIKSVVTDGSEKNITLGGVGLISFGISYTENRVCALYVFH